MSNDEFPNDESYGMFSSFVTSYLVVIRLAGSYTA